MADLGEFGRARAIEHGEEAEPDTFRFHGETFTVPARLSSLVLMEFAHDAKATSEAQERARRDAERARAVLDRAQTTAALDRAQADLTDAEVALNHAGAESMAAMYRYIRACVGDDQWGRFRDVVLREGVDEDELMMVCAELFSAVAGRPTKRSSASADGPSSTGATSMGGSVSPEPTPGPSPVMGQVVELTPAQRARQEIAQVTAPVGDLLGIRSSG